MALSLSVVLTFMLVIYVGMEPHEVYPFHMPGKLGCLPSGMKRGFRQGKELFQQGCPGKMSSSDTGMVVLGPVLSNELQRCPSTGVRTLSPANVRVSRRCQCIFILLMFLYNES